MRLLRSSATLLIGVLLAVAARADQPALRAPTEAEAAWHAKILATIEQALPKSFRGWDVNRFPSATDASHVEECEGTTCAHREHIRIVYSVPNLEADASKAGSEMADEIREDDMNYVARLNRFLAKLYGKKSLEVDLYVNFDGTLGIPHCKEEPPESLKPPRGWAGWYQGSALDCIGQKEVHDQGVASLGAAPTVTPDGSCYPTCTAKAVWTLDPASNKSFDVRNIVLSLRGSESVVDDYLHSLDTRTLTAMLAPPPS